MVPKFESADRFKSKEISPTPAIMNSQLQLAIVRKIYIFKLEIILSTESELVWPCESRAEGKRQIVTSRKCQT